MWDRFDADAALEHPLRQAIVDLAREQPGVPFSSVHDRLKTVSGNSSLGYGSLSYHLHRLERAGILRSHRSGRHRRYYPTGSGFGDLAAVSVVQRPRTLEVARLITQGSGVTSDQIAERLGAVVPLSRQVVSYHLRLLKRAGLIVAMRVGRRLTYASASRLTGIIAKLGKEPTVLPVPPGPVTVSATPSLVGASL